MEVPVLHNTVLYTVFAFLLGKISGDPNPVPLTALLPQKVNLTNSSRVRLGRVYQSNSEELQNCGRVY